MRPFTVQNTRGEQCVFVDFRLYPDKQYAAGAWDKLDPLIGHQVVNDVAIMPDGTAKLRQLWTRWMGREPALSYKNERIVLDLAAWIERKQIIVLRRVPPKVPQLVQTPPKYVAPVKQEPAKPVVCDWKIECGHHAKGKRSFGKTKLLQVVPEKNDKGKWIDVVKVHYKETPHRDVVLKAGGTDLAKKGADRGYTVYALDAEYPPDSFTNFLFPAFWDAFRKPVVYDISGGAEDVRVEVFNPHTYKFEMSLPPFKSTKLGTKYEKGTDFEGEGKDRKAVKRDWHHKFDASDSGWTKSGLVVKSGTRWVVGEGPQDDSDKEAIAPTISFKRDNTAVEIDSLKTLGTILHLVKSFNKIVTTVKESIPVKVGWYFDYDLQFMQGGLGVEWSWKEWEDHTTFHFIDFNIQLTLISLKLEFGFGLSGCAFKAQIYAQVAGSVDVSANGRLENPNTALAVNIPANAKIEGSIGARVEAGNFIKANASASTGFTIGINIGIHRLDRNRDPKHSSLLSFDFTGTWTGIKVSASVSCGAFGVGPGDTWEAELCGPLELWKGQWPEPTEYVAPDLSPDRIRQVMLDKITEGWDLLVTGSMQKRGTPPKGVPLPDISRRWNWTPEEIANALTTVIVAHPTCSRTGDMINGLATAVRVDLDQLAERGAMVRDHVAEVEFCEYLTKPAVRNGTIRGLPHRLDGLVDPAQKMAQAAAKKKT